TVALAGAIMLGGMGVHAFAIEKTEVKTDRSSTMETYGVLSHSSGRLYLTPFTVTETEGKCGNQDFACRIVVDTEQVTIQDPGGNPYILDTDTYTPLEGAGPYSESL